MYNLLIVDDEKIIREGLYELISIEDSLELNLYLAASGIEAIKILGERKIDIVLTDINMPKMSGIKLFEIIQEKWSHCKVIFLTGYSEFDYVYKVQKTARYILKAEEDEKIISAISETVEEIENNFMIKQIVKDSSLLDLKNREQDKNKYLYDLFDGFIDISEITGELTSRLGINLDITEKIYYTVMRHDNILRESYEEHMAINRDLMTLIEKYYFDLYKGVAFHFSRNYVVILMQPLKRNSIEGNVLSIKGRSELFQKAFIKNFELKVSIIIGGTPLYIKNILDEFHSIKSKLVLSGDEALIIKNDSVMWLSDKQLLNTQQKNIITSRLELLDYYFENSNKEHVIALLNETRKLFLNNMEMENLFGIEIYTDIAVRLIRYINSYQLPEEIYKKTEANKLYKFSTHKSWEEAFIFLINISEILFDFKKNSKEKNMYDVIHKVKKYIYDNLSGDTSLDTLADIVGFCPEYLLRLFKKSVGVTILQYINDLKIIKAKKLIIDYDKQIKEIAYELGFSSSGYFGRFFKSKTGISPQSYRDQQK